MEIQTLPPQLNPPPHKVDLSQLFLEKAGITGDNPINILRASVMDQIEMLSNRVFLKMASKISKRLDLDEETS